MNVQAEKLELVRMLLNTEDQVILKKIRAIFKSASQDEGRISIRQYNKEIDAAEKRITKGKFVTHEEVLALLKK